MSIEANIAGRRAAEEIRQGTVDAVLLVLELAQGTANEVDAKTFWTGLAVACLDRAGMTQEAKPEPLKPRPSLSPMSDQEAAMFGRKVMAYGRHQGKRYADIDLDYLQWLDGEKWPEALALHRYVESDYVQREIDDE